MTTLNSTDRPHGLKGRKGKNQTRKGLNHRYVIFAKELRAKNASGAIAAERGEMSAHELQAFGDDIARFHPRA